MHYPKAEEVKLSIGLLSNVNDNKIIHLCNTDTGSSESLILSLHTGKVLGIHVGGKNTSFNLGTFIKYPINKFFEKNNYSIDTENKFEKNQNISQNKL